MKLKNKVALITGGAGGIGGAVAVRFAQEGAQVIILGLNENKLDAHTKLITSSGGNAHFMLCDVTSESDVKRAVHKTLSLCGKIDILFNAAGITMVSLSEKLSLENWNKCMNINSTGTFLMCREVGEAMIDSKSGGKIINVTSVTAHAGIPERAAYAASKGSVKQLAQVLAIEWAKHNIQVNAISPGFIVTEIVKDLIKRGVHNPQKLEARIPAGRMGQPEDIAGPAVFLASADSNYVTGTTLIVDGGFLANGYLDLN